MAHWGEITPKGCVGVQREYSAICWDADNIGTDGRIAIKGTSLNNCSGLKAKYGDPGVNPPPQVAPESAPTKAEWLGSYIWGSWYVNDPACGYVAPVPVVSTVPPAPTIPTPTPAAPAPAPPAPTATTLSTPAAPGTPSVPTTGTTPTTGSTGGSTTTGGTTTNTGTSNSPSTTTQESSNTWIYIVVAIAVIIVVIIIIAVVVYAMRSKRSSRLSSQQFYDQGAYYPQ